MLFSPTILPLPAVLHDRLDALSQTLLTGDGSSIDFSLPHGEAALVPAHSISWRVFKNPVSLFIGGVAAVLLEFAEPKVRDGVWQHSSFRTEPMKRLQRTGLAAMVTVYAARSQAEAMIRGVVRAHGRVTGTTIEGEDYHANDPRLLDWVQATASFGFLHAYHRFVQPLSQHEQDRFFQEGAEAAALYGAIGAPSSSDDWTRLLVEMEPRLTASPIVFEFLDIMCRVRALPGLTHRLQPSLVRAAVDLLPPMVRERLRLGPDWALSQAQRMTVKLAARSADRILLMSSPAVQACRRLGLPDDFLYRPAG
jgi:uncharacterized protein (DUF2236 family)